MDLSESQPRALLEKDGQQAWLGLLLVKVLHPEILSTPKEGGILFIKEVKSGEKVTIPVVGLDGKVRLRNGGHIKLILPME